MASTPCLQYRLFLPFTAPVLLHSDGLGYQFGRIASQVCQFQLKVRSSGCDVSLTRLALLRLTPNDESIVEATRCVLEGAPT